MWNDMQIEKVKVRWNGWTASISDLLDAGWELERRIRYDYVKTGWGHGRRCEKGAHILLRNPALGVLGRLTYDPAMHDYTYTYFNLDFLTFAKAFRQRGTKTPFITRSDLGVSRDDVGALLDLISELQQEYPQPTKIDAAPVSIKKAA